MWPEYYSRHALDTFTPLAGSDRARPNMPERFNIK